MRLFQKRILSGNPSRSRGLGNNSRKKSASRASKDRNPFGTIFTGWLSEFGVAWVVQEVPAGVDATVEIAWCAIGVAEGEPAAFTI
jgi:hypothetical protein